MTTEQASIVVVALFGLLIGVILQVVMQVLPPRKAAPGGRGAAAEDGKVRQLIEKAKDQAEAARVQVKGMPRSHQMVFLVFYGLIGILVLVIRMSPVRMNWWVFLGSVFGGFVLAQFVFWLARTNRIRATPREMGGPG